ncbi:hypothetical protein BurJ1DRAFT_3078 [Burkholderiales bacterium JOSHI_001]|nr:hypothetical protein BurJ1DRAFT_3078 [Burkholderiales bacterium JOSHI_001]
MSRRTGSWRLGAGLRLVALLLATWAGQATAGDAVAPAAVSAERGRVLYETGVLADGSAVSAWREGTGALPARAAACVFCHRSSTRGGTEGGVRVPSIAGDKLFAAGQLPSAAKRLRRQWQRHQTRSAYDSASLARALAEGLDPDGQPLASAMPRYRLDAGALADLEAYLRLRGQDPTPGLGQGEMHLASVITPQASPERRRSVVQALQAWAATMGFKAFQVKWQLWELTGPSSTWATQLHARWQAQPVYALVSGAGGHEWEPVQDFCEAQRLPCLFPVLDRIPATGASHWSMYLGGGVEAEARMLAQWLNRPAQSDKGAKAAPPRVFQVHDTPAGAAAARQLAQTLAASGSVPPVLDADAAAGVPAPQERDTLVLWLGPAAAQAWLKNHTPERAPRVVLSAQLAPPQAVEVPMPWRSRVVWVSQRSDPVRHAAGAALSLRPWMAQLGLDMPAHPNDLADVHAATFFFGDAFSQTLGQFQPDHLLERLEVALDRRPAGAGFYRLSLGPAQRTAAQGGHILAFKPPERAYLAPLAGYLRAED